MRYSRLALVGGRRAGEICLPVQAESEYKAVPAPQRDLVADRRRLRAACLMIAMSNSGLLLSLLRTEKLKVRAGPVCRRLKVAGVVLPFGLAVEALSLLGKGPVAFLVFSALCAMLIVAGILLFLHGLVS